MQIPDYECCSDCGMTEMEIAEQKNKLQGAGEVIGTIYEDPELIESK